MISIIAAVARNGIIGCNGRIPWNIPEDMEYFRRITTGCIVIMGRKTYEEIGRPLSDRFNIVVSQSKNFTEKNLLTVNSLEEAISFGEKYASEHNISHEIFLCGGQNIYKQGIKYAKKLYITNIDKDYDGDSFFPEFSRKSFHKIKQVSGKTAGVRFCIYEAVSLL